MAGWGGDEARKSLESVLEDPDKLVARWALDGLVEQGSKRSLPAIGRLLAGEDKNLRAAAIRAYGRLGGKTDIPRISAFLEHSDANTRSAALWTLGKLGAREAIPSILERLEDFNESVQWNAVQALATLRAEEAIPELRKTLREIKPRSRASVFWALVRLEDPDASGVIRPFLEDSDPLTRVAAASALCALGERDGVGVLLNECRDIRWPMQTKSGSLYAGKSPRYLNALRRPKTWKKLDAPLSQRGFIGTRKQHVEQIGKEAGLEVEWSKNTNWGDAAWFWGAPAKRRGPSPTLLTSLNRLLQGQYVMNKCPRYEFILEPGKFRVVTYIEAIRFWEKWERAGMGRRREF